MSAGWYGQHSQGYKRGAKPPAAARRPGGQVVKLTGRDIITFSPLGNARATVAISDDGRDWNPWTAFVAGAYQGRR